MSNYKEWGVKYCTEESTCSESLVVAPDRGEAKRLVSSMVGVQTFETVEEIKPIPTAMAEQRFDGYAPRLRAGISGVDAVARRVRGR